MQRAWTQRGRSAAMRVLDYFDVMIRLARSANDRRALNHWEHCWAMVAALVYGDCRVPPQFSAPQMAAMADIHQRHLTSQYGAASSQCGTGTASPRPQWYIDKYSRPLRKVVARTIEQVPDARSRKIMEMHWDVLECHHKLSSHAHSYGARPARHRRCDQCPRQSPVVPNPARKEAVNG